MTGPTNPSNPTTTTPATGGTGTPSTGSTTSDAQYMSRSGKRGTSWGWIAAIVVIIVIIAGVAGAYAAHIGPFAQTSSPGTTSCSSLQASIAASGSTFVYPMMNVWSSTFYQTTYPGCAQVNYAALGSGTGVTQLTDRLTNFGASDAPLNPTQNAAMPAPYFTFPDASGAVTVIYNVAGTSNGLNLTGPIVADIYLGTITNWDDASIQAINPHTTLPNLAITPVYRSDSSGTTYVFSHFLAADSPTFNSKVGAGLLLNWPVGVSAKGSTGVAGTVASTKGAIGYAELNYAKSSGDDYASIENPANNFILPNVTNTAAAINAIAPTLPKGSDYSAWANVTAINQAGAQTYPLATMTYIIVYQDLGKAYGTTFSLAEAQWMIKFFKWIVDQGQSFATELFYVPLPASVTTANLATINSITYNGAAIST